MDVDEDVDTRVSMSTKGSFVLSFFLAYLDNLVLHVGHGIPTVVKNGVVRSG